MQEETCFYCQNCNAAISIDQLGKLDEGACPSCGSNLGFSTAPKGESDGFEEAVVLNDTDFLN